MVWRRSSAMSAFLREVAKQLRSLPPGLLRPPAASIAAPAAAKRAAPRAKRR